MPLPLGQEELYLTLQPRADQVEDYLTLVSWQRCANYSEVGTGKSFVSYLLIMKSLLEGLRVLVVMPPPLIPQYIYNFHKILPGNPYTVVRLHKAKATREKDMAAWTSQGKWPQVLVTSYQLFVKYHRELYAKGCYGLLVADEAHNIGLVQTHAFRAFFCFVYGRRPIKLLLMTATPAMTEIQSNYTQVKLRDPKVYTNLDQFDRMHVEYETRTIQVNNKKGQEMPKKIQVISGYKNLDTLQVNLMRGAVRRRAAEVLSLEAPTIIDHLVILEPKHEALYQTLLQERILELGEEIRVAKNASALRQMALQIITNPNLYMPPESPLPGSDISPLEVLKSLLGVMPLKESKVLVFCHFQNTVKMLEKELSEYNPALVYGGSNTDTNVKKLLEDGTCRIGILNFASGGAGFNLQGVSHHVIVYEAIGSPGMIQQGLGRVHRGGQQKPVVAWIFRYGASLSARLLNKALERAGSIKVTVGDDFCFADFIIEGVDIL